MFRRHDGGADAPTAYQMHQQMFAIGDDFWIERGGMRAFKVDGKALRLRKTLLLEDATGRELYKIQEKLVTVRDVMDIENATGPVATVKKALISPLREHFEVDLHGRGKWDVQGKITDHEYEISGPGGRIAHVSKAWFRVRDTYGVEIGPGQDDAFVLAVAIVVDQMSHPHR